MAAFGRRSRNPATAAGAGTAQHYPIVCGGHSPPPGRGVQWVVVIGERPLQCTVEDVASGQSQAGLQIEGRLGLDARTVMGSRS